MYFFTIVIVEVLQIFFWYLVAFKSRQKCCVIINNTLLCFLNYS